MSAGSIEVDIENSAFLIGALPINSFLMDFRYVVDVLVALNPHNSHFHDKFDNWRSQRIRFESQLFGPHRNSFNYDLG